MKKSICIVGSGFSSLCAGIILVNNKYKPTIIDIGGRIKKEKYPSILKPFFYKKKDNQIYLFGGLSNVWKGVISQYFSGDFRKWNKSYDIEHLFPKLQRIYKFQLAEQEVSSVDNKIYYKLKKISKFCKRKEIPSKLFFYPSRILINSNKSFQTFNIESILKKLIKDKKIIYIKGKIIKFFKAKNKIKIAYIFKKKLVNMYVDRIFLGAGAISTNTIVNNSTHAYTKITANKKFISFGFFKKQLIPLGAINTFPVFQGFFLNKRKECIIYLQIYSLSQIICQLLGSFFYRFVPFKFILNKITVVYGSFNYKNSPIFSLDKFNKIQSLKENNSKSKLRNLVSKALRKNYLFNLLPSIFFLPNLAGNHFGSSFPMSRYKKNHTTQFGELKNLPGVSIIDTSSFSDMSAVPPTLNLMCHSYSIVNNVLRHKI